jgi:hypothetical protein
MLGQRIVDVVVIAGRFNRGLCASIPLGEVVKVRVLDANLFDDLSSLIHYCHLCVPFVDVNSEVHGLFTRDASA